MRLCPISLFLGKGGGEGDGYKEIESSEAWVDPSEQLLPMVIMIKNDDSIRDNINSDDGEQDYNNYDNAFNDANGYNKNEIYDNNDDR